MDSGFNACRFVILAPARIWKQCQKAISAQVLQTYKIAALNLSKGCSAGLQLHTCSACQHHTRSPVPVSPLAPQFRQLKPFGVHCEPSSKPFSTVAMACKKQSAIAAQPSGVFEQEVVTQEVPLSVTTPAKKSRRGQVTTDTNQVVHSTDALVASAGFTDTLADRIKSGSGRRKTKITKAKTDVGAAAVNALADIIDAMIMPGQGATERYLDSRDADLNVPDHIPGASSEQRQHAKQPAARAAVPSRQATGDAPDGTQTPELRSKQPVKKRRSKVAKPGVIQIASELAQGPDMCEDKLQEDQKVPSNCFVSSDGRIVLLTDSGVPCGAWPCL